MNQRTFFLPVLLSLTLLAAQSAPPDVSGAWKWNLQRSGGDSIEILMKLKQDSNKLSGVISGPEGNEVEIRDGKIADDGKLAFFIVLERDGDSMKINFDGKAAGDTITGNTKYINPQGEEREREWVAKRQVNLSGNWKSSFKRQDGTAMETPLTLRQEGEKLMGKTTSRNGDEISIQDGKVQGTEVSFRIIRERDGRNITARYRGKIENDRSIKGYVESDWSGEFRRMDWEATREN